MSRCKLQKGGETKWEVDPSYVGHTDIPGHEHTIHRSMLDKIEYAGVFGLVQKSTKDCNGNRCKETIVNFVVPESLEGGKGMSVKSPKGLCNFHTHPLYCYEGAGSPSHTDLCIWGWASGEDMRESVIFAMKGNLIHLIFAMEGVYAIQVNPWIVDLLRKEFKDNLRGMIVCVIENYFKSTHGFRNCVHNHNRNEICTPYDWIKFANNFTLDNLTETTKERCSKNLSCKGTPSTRGKSILFKNFLYDWDLPNYSLTKSGTLSEKNCKRDAHAKLIEREFNTVIKKINAIGEKPGWKRGQWFNVSFSHNEIQGIGTIRDLLNSNPTTQQIYDLWSSFRNNPEILRFGKERITFKTPKVITKGHCKMK